MTFHVAISRACKQASLTMSAPLRTVGAHYEN
jgi:hypothetical protein